MSTEVDALLATGDRALADGDWPAARAAFQAALEATETAEAMVGLADALWWLGELRESVTYRERAYEVFRRRDDPVGSAAAAWRLSLEYGDNLGNTAAGLGWLALARRLADDHGLVPLQGWVLLLDAHYTSDPKECEQLASRCLESARASADASLQLCALSQLGAALVEQGRLAEGIRLLDEAMAGSLAGGGGSPEPVVYISCTTLQACTSCADFPRAVQWLRATDRFARQFGSPYLRADCRIHYGTILVAIGDWTQAEEELTTAIALSGEAMPAVRDEALVALAALRLAQGRMEEAARLAHGLDGRPGAAEVIGRLYLRQGRPESARSVLQRGLVNLGARRLQAVALRELLGEALLACGEVAAAREHGEELVALGTAHGCQVATAYGARLCARVSAEDVASVGDAGSGAAARGHLDIALATFVDLGMPWEAARTRLLLGHQLREQSPQAAVDEARTALAALDGLGARADADAAAALLRELGASAARATSREAGALTAREQEVLALLGEGLSNPEIAERLYLSRKTVEHHVARVLSKRGLRSRAAAAAEAVRGGRTPRS